MSPPEETAAGATGHIDVSIASEPCDIGSVPDLLKDLSFLQHNLDIGNRESRLYLLNKARRLVQALESPRETMLRHCGAEVCFLFSFFSST